MRYAKGHKENSRARILEVASQRFRRDGIAGAGLAGVMNDAGMTNGAFYAHFKSKEDLLREVLVSALDLQRQSLEAGDVDLTAEVKKYLSTAHRDHPELGCISAATVPELSRHSKATRTRYTKSLRGIFAAIAKAIPGNRRDAERSAIAVFGLLVGSLQLSRAVDDEALSQQILDDGIRAALSLVSRS